MMCSVHSMALSADALSLKETKPNPRDRFVNVSRMTTALVTGPNWLKYFWSFSNFGNARVRIGKIKRMDRWEKIEETKKTGKKEGASC